MCISLSLFLPSSRVCRRFLSLSTTFDGGKLDSELKEREKRRFFTPSKMNVSV